ncbi:TetR/AcrR family transcriptional regulator [Paraburkholderia podalyriae]|uniref:TetR/AcrR family transcriptional regulator n=1 Tax=Paraburkholderia podalyriae TaxID=1938811 RepID=A0ABR7PLD8_9BURK|nr:TetR/AcrR family transcriptional regulator [Paraburkholderia podalyriae]MBC8746618.1 TetR/AcrR family transcriptional regulator [Paraburkholderia podalyriae]
MEVALDGAIRIFRERGYQGASLGDLGSAMGLTAGSIYKAFADKRAVFLAALDRYIQLRNGQLQSLIDAEQSGRDKVRAVLQFYAESAIGGEGKRGCLVVGSAIDLLAFDDEIAGHIVAALQRIERLLCRLIRLGQTDGSIPSAVDSDATGRALLSLTQGFRVVGKVGRSRAHMMAAADQAMRLLD